MKEPEFPSEPPRLAGEAGDTARLLAQAEREFRGDLDESAAFRRLERTRRRRGSLVWLGTSAGVAAGLALLATGYRVGWRTTPIELTAEVRRTPPAKVIVATSAQPSRAAEPTSALAQVPDPSINTPPRVPAEAPSAPAPTEAKCREWSAAGRIERAVDCFRAVARGAGLQGEVALYEAARLTFDGLRDPNRALGLLAEYEKRFPGGAMRGEAAWLRVRAARDAGRLDEALASSEALLVSPAGRALASELHWLRGQIYQDNRKDCAQAASEFVSLVGEPGARGDEAEFRRAGCLEQLGRTSDAAQAYERYLTRSDAKRINQAKQRLSALRQ
jgi:hypothetical protein